MAPDPTTAALLPEAIRGAAQACSFAPRELLARQGSAPRFMFFVLAGEVRLARAGRDGEAVILQRVRRGWVGEASLFARRYHCDLVAAAATGCLRVPVGAFSDALASSPDFAREWMAGLSSEVRRLRSACERLGLRGAERRVRHAIESEGSAGRLPLAGTLKDWAAELGLTHEALYRTVARMEAEGTLRREAGCVVLLA